MKVEAYRVSKIIVPMTLLFIQLSNAAYAEDANKNIIEEIIVTAQKRPESVQDIPISIDVFNAENLEIRRIEGVQDLGIGVPGLWTAPISSTPNGQRLAIRGLGNVDTTISIDSKVAIYFDGIYNGKANGLVFDNVDLERIEVLKGPQGTLYGRNAVAGAINFIPKKASTDRLGGKLSFSYGNYNATDVKGSLNIPVSDSFAVKVAGSYSERDGWVENNGPGTDFNGYDRYGVRIDALWEPTSSVALNYSYDFANSQNLPSYAQPIPVPTPGFLVAVGAVTDPPSSKRKDEVTTSDQIIPREGEIETKGHTFTVDWNWSEDHRLSFKAGYRDLESATWFAAIVGQDAAGIQRFVTGLFLRGGLPLETAAALASRFDTLFVADDNVAANIEQENYSLELNQIGRFGNNLEYTIGLYYYNEDVLDPRGPDNRPTKPGDVVDFLFANADGTSLFRGAQMDTEAYAVFGQLTWTPAILDERLHFTVGARYSKDERDITIVRLAPGTYEPFFSIPVPPFTIPIDPVPLSDSFDSVDPSFIVKFDVNPNAMVYASAVSGYRAGGFNINGNVGSTSYDPATVDRDSLIFDSEGIWAYEVGSKGTYFDGHLRINAAAFYYDLEDDQQTVSGVNLTQRAVVNTTSTYKGGEIALSYAPIPGLILGAQWAYLDAESDSFENPFFPGVIVTPQNAGAPENMYTLQLDYERALMRAWNLRWHVDFQHRDKVKPNDAATLGSADVLNSSLSFIYESSPTKRYTVSLWAQNLTDDEYLFDKSPFAAFSYDNVTWGTPRTYGVSLSAGF